MTIRASFPSLRPSLDLHFARTKRLDPRVTFSRPSTATYVDAGGVLRTAAANAPRFDHNPTTGESLGLLVEESRTNGFVGSESLTGLVGSAANVAASAVVTPSNNTNAISITEDNTNAQHYTSISVPLTSGTAVSVSVFARLGTGTRQLIIRGLAAQFGSITDTRFDLSAGTVAAGTGSIQRFPNNWYRCTFTATPTATTTALIRLHLGDGSTVSYQGDNESSILIYGPQAENGAFPTSYIPTTASAATRAADTCSLGGSNYGSWANESQGVFFAEAQSFQTAATANIALAISDGTLNNRIDLNVRAGSLGGACRAIVQSGGTSSFDTGNIAAPAFVANTYYKQSVAYQLDNFAHAFQGDTLRTDTSGAVPISPTFLDVGSRNGSSLHLNGHLRRLAFWPQRLPDSTLLAITQ